MPVGAGNHSKLKRVYAKAFLILKTKLQRAPGVLVSEHPIFFFLGAANVVPIPVLKICELIIRAKRRVSFTVSLYLRYLIDRLPPRSGFGVAASDFLAVHRRAWEHHAIGQVAIVGDRHHACASLILDCLQRLPELPGIGTFLRREGCHKGCLVRSVSVDHHPM